MRGAEQKKGATPEVGDFYGLRKEMQIRCGSTIGAFTIKDRRFRKYFGCNTYVALVL